MCFLLIFATAQHLDSSCAGCWNRAVRLGRPDLLEVCANSDSPLVEAVENAGGQGLRTSFWNGYDLTTRGGRERLYQFCSRKRPRHVWFSSPCRVSGASSQRVSRILDGIAAVVPRVQALGCHVHFCTTTQRVQLETEFVDEHVREDDESSRQRLCLGLARFTRKSIEPILASFDNISRCSTSAESSNLRQETQTRQTL